MTELLPQDTGAVAYFGTFRIEISTADPSHQHLIPAAAGMVNRVSRPSL